MYYNTFICIIKRNGNKIGNLFNLLHNKQIAAVHAILAMYTSHKNAAIIVLVGALE